MDPRALPGTCYVPRLWLWPGQAVYVGPPLGLDPHSASVSCLAVAVGGTLRVRIDATTGPPVRSVLVPPRLTHRLVADADLVVFCYLDPGSARHRTCRQAMTTPAGSLAYCHRSETSLAALAGDLADADRARAWLDLAGAGSPSTGGHGDGGAASPLDSRIARALAVLQALEPEDDAPAARLAALVGLSPSRFLHLFREHTGTSYRRYRLWVRMLRAAEVLRAGHDLTAAAAGAGFASPSHFSDSFHRMFGLRPRRLLGTEIHLGGP